MDKSLYREIRAYSEEDAILGLCRVALMPDPGYWEQAEAAAAEFVRQGRRAEEVRQHYSGRLPKDLTITFHQPTVDKKDPPRRDEAPHTPAAWPEASSRPIRIPDPVTEDPRQVIRELCALAGCPERAGIFLRMGLDPERVRQDLAREKSPIHFSSGMIDVAEIYDRRNARQEV